jgi:hypothetical protein
VSDADKPFFEDFREPKPVATIDHASRSPAVSNLFAGHSPNFSVSRFRSFRTGKRIARRRRIATEKLIEKATESTNPDTTTPACATNQIFCHATGLSASRAGTRRENFRRARPFGEGTRLRFARVFLPGTRNAEAC